MDDQLTLPCDVGKVSDGYHKFDELYSHRNHLFVILLNICCKVGGFWCWKAKYHEDGSMFEGGWIIAGMTLKNGDTITYHLPDTFYYLLVVDELERAPKWDGHSPNDVIQRMEGWLNAPQAS